MFFNMLMGSPSGQVCGLTPLQLTKLNATKIHIVFIGTSQLTQTQDLELKQPGLTISCDRKASATARSLPRCLFNARACTTHVRGAKRPMRGPGQNPFLLFGCAD